jgi:hypothetical protein
MLNLTDENVGFILVSPCNSINEDKQVQLSKAQSILFSKEYNILSLTGYCGGDWDKSIIAYNEVDNNNIRKDAIHIMKSLNTNDIVVKYKGDTQLKLIESDGSENPLSIQNYSEYSDDTKVYIFEGWYFSLKKEKKYFLIDTKSQIKKGMKVEYFNNEKWNEKTIQDPDLEWSNMYQLLTKYGKLRAVAS